MENQNDNEEMEIQHRLYIVDEDINVDELPNEILKAMRNFNAKLKKYEESEDESEQNDLFYELQQDDVSIADDMLTWWEDENSEEEEEHETEEEEQPQHQQQRNNGNNGQSVNNNRNNNGNNGNAPAQNNQNQTSVTPVTPVSNVDPSEQKVRDLIKNKVISVADLTNAIGREPEYPEHQVGNIRLRKQYLKAFYEVL